MRHASHGRDLAGSDPGRERESRWEIPGPRPESPVPCAPPGADERQLAELADLGPGDGLQLEGGGSAWRRARHGGADRAGLKVPPEELTGAPYQREILPVPAS